MSKQRFAFVYGAAICLTTSWYIYQIVVGLSAPVLATWLTFFIGSSASLFTYIRHEEKRGRKPDFLANMSNIGSVVQTSLVSLALLWVRSPFAQNAVQKFCLLSVLGTLVYYYMSKKAFRTNIAINIVMGLGYVPTLYHLWTATRNSESFVLWGVMGVVTGIAWSIPLRQRNWLAATYAGRSCVLTLSVLVLMLRLWWKN